ncbi:2OG-Fe(II) oxygenase [Streptomyces sp. NPDC054863]
MIDLEALERQLHDPAADCLRRAPYDHYVWNGLIDPQALRAAADGYPHLDRMVVKAADNPRWHSQDRTLADPALRALCEALLSDELAARISAVTGIPDLCTDPAGDWGSYRVSTRGAVHAAHIGSNRHPETRWLRRYSLFTYLNEDWQEADGGLLELWEPDARAARARVLPVFNRSVLIETTSRSLHGVSPVLAPGPVGRKSVTVHFWTRPDVSGPEEQE